MAIIEPGRIAADGSPARLKAALGGESINLLFDTPQTAERALSELDGIGDWLQLDRDVVRPCLSRAPEIISMVGAWDDPSSSIFT